MNERDPLCEQALATNYALRQRVDELERRLVSGKGHLGLRARLTAAERELRERDAGAWTYLPWRGYAS